MQQCGTMKTSLGWREWISLPDLGIPAIKAKVDSGAKTSALHAFAIETDTKNAIEIVRFKIHPLQKREDIVLTCEAPVKDKRQVTDSGGHREMRFVIESHLVIGENTITVELTLTNRDSMQFRMLLGRSAMAGLFCIDPAASYLVGKKPPHPYRTRSRT